MDEGYVLDFSNRTMEEYFADEFDIEFYSEENTRDGGSKAKTLRTILDDGPPVKTGQILRKLWDYRDNLNAQFKAADADDEKKMRDNYFATLTELEGGMQAASLDAFTSHNQQDETLGLLLETIQRDIRNDRFAEAMDRVHTYCTKKFRHLLNARNESSDKSEPLHSLVGKYCKVLEREGQVAEMSLQIFRMSISVFEKFNTVRNDQSFAHDNPTLLDAKNARLVFDTVSAVMRFAKSIDQHYGS